MLATVNGLLVGYTDEGVGMSLLFVHGFPLDRTMWSRQVGAFRTGFRVIAPDLRGFGESEATEGPVSMSSYAEDLHGLLWHLNAGPVILAGHAMGGYIALAFASAFPREVRGLVLVSTKSGPDTSGTAAEQRALAEHVRSAGLLDLSASLAPRMLSAWNADGEMAASLRSIMAASRPEGIISALLGMAERPDARPALRHIQARTLVIAGANDALAPLSDSEALMMAIPGAQLRIIPRAGHLVAWEEPESFNEALWTWLAW
ncbi:MAG TPA: alpha/beta hydrolase, partial [Holophaga sp.]|nr:alpha/beta hydrolase [Holophaga sp.]